MHHFSSVRCNHDAISYPSTRLHSVFTSKAFINQIEAARAEQVVKRAAYIDALFACVSPTHQLEFTVEDVPVLQDTLKLVFSFLD